MHCAQFKKIKTSKGFTLIEILVVIVIMGILLATAATSMNFMNSERKVKTEAVELKTMLGTAEQEAILLPAVLELKIDANGYQFFRLTAGKWKPLSHDNLSHSNAFANVIVPKVTTSDKTKQIVFSSSGEVQPFQIDLSDEKHSVLYRLQLNQDGQIELVNKTDHSHE